MRIFAQMEMRKEKRLILPYGMSEMISHSATETTAVSEAIVEVAKTVDAVKAIVFGSFARGTQTRHSDIDIVFVKNTDERFVERSQQILSLLYERIQGRSIDVLVYTPAEFSRMLSSGNKFIGRVLREGQIVYGD